MFVSLNEIDVSVKRAMRGIGMGWGIAEEAGKAARFLASRDLPALEVLLPLLHAQDGVTAASLTPRICGGDWRADGGSLCPIIAGVALADDPGEIIRRKAIDLRDVNAPLLLLPFVSRAARSGQTGIWCTASSLAFKAYPDGGVTVAGDLQVPRCDLMGVVAVSSRDASRDGNTPLRESLESVVVDDALWQDLQSFAARTYVPASNRSRLMGAGAGLSDND